MNFNLKGLANLISTVRNLLVIGIFFGFYFHFTREEPESLKNLPLIFALVVVLPLVGFTGYTVLTRNFEDSNKKKRNSVYVLLIFLLATLSFIAKTTP